MELCSHCHENPPRRPGQRWCSKCHAGHMREWRSKNDMTPEQRRRASCRSYTHVLVARGHLVKGPCEVCGIPEVEAHHDDYSNPRLVRWRCKAHHRDLHKPVVPHVLTEISTQEGQNAQHSAS